MAKKSYPRIVSGCGLIGIMRASGKRVDGSEVITSVASMHERSNGLGGGFAAYGIYPEFKDYYALQVMFDGGRGKEEVEQLLGCQLDIVEQGPIPTRGANGVGPSPLLWRYFARAKEESLEGESVASEDDLVLRLVMDINVNVEGAFVMSSGKNMGAFKGVGFAGDLGEFYRLDEYHGHTWIGHARFPTNTPGWWGGAHPFTLLDWAVVHNGEISSYGINRRYLEMFGYVCTLQTDTEVMAYLLDLLIRRQRMPIELACRALAPPFWKDIDRLPEGEKRKMLAIRSVYGSAMVNGPFAIIFGHSRGMVGFNDRIKLRPMVAGTKDDILYIASEEAAIREICPNPDRVWSPPAGEPVIGWLEEGVS